MKNLQLVFVVAIMVVSAIFMYSLVPQYDLKEHLTRQLETYKQRYNP